jgi:hypothetical protein
MDADGNQGAGDDRNGVIAVCALAALIKNGDEQETDERAGERGGRDLRGDDKRSSRAPVRIGQMTLASGTGGHQWRLGTGATITQAHPRRESQRPSYQSPQFRV